MARHTGPVLVDTNVVIECWRVGAWRALSGGYRVETVEDCVVETQTGFQRRRPEQIVDLETLRAGLVAVHRVTDRQLAEVAVRAPDIALDAGERALWAHALTRPDAWVLCGPDSASMRFGVRAGFRDRLVALQSLLRDAGDRARELREQFTARWLAAKVGQFVIDEGNVRR